MRTNKHSNLFLNWFGTQVDKTYDALTEAIWREGNPELAGVPISIHHAIHKVALLQLLAAVCFPKEALGGLADEKACVDAYKEFVRSQNHLLVEYCAALAAWRLDEQKKGCSTRVRRSVEGGIPVLNAFPEEDGAGLRTTLN
jgi:hypothetical protein